MPSTLLRMFSQYSRAEPAFGSTQARPTIAMSAACVAGTSICTMELAARAWPSASTSAAPAVTSACNASTSVRALERGHLAQHVHALCTLLCGVQRQQFSVQAVARAAFRGNAQAAENQLIQYLPRFIARHLAFAHFRTLAEVFFGERRVGAATRVTRAGFQRDRPFAFDHFLLELRNNRTVGDDFLREEIRATHQDADMYAARRQRRGQHLHHRGRHRIVYAAGEKHLDLGGVV